MTTSLRGASVAAASLLIAGMVALPASAEPGSPTLGNLPDITDSMVQDAIVDLDASPVDLTPVVEEIETTSTEGSEQVVTLNSDILFAFDKAAISPAATSKIAALVKDVPQGAKVSIGGHTDSLGTAARNASLSQERAAAVAGAIKTARPDLVLTVKGFGSSQEVEPNTKGGEDNPDGRAKNRRVEIRYAS
ncbi:hypothetical protein N802_05305 [Knoellia sinensis KCTC 19936]|uniref:OmpA-like domain-containing protein n=1 Tax=Knoellia sinensis KCTC 19936 TaxID=1385520 RepID=A0A0A0J1T0_9MICO|nr:OmpA family protein [Knoellia sinensis]KGN31023.1 hypothetical protein N802_05305 [Knoellia sinensis KCTC 19936]